MRKTRIHLLLATNTLILYGLVLFLLPEGDLRQWIVIAIAMAVMMAAPALIINRELNVLSGELKVRNRELDDSRNEFEKLKTRFDQVTTRDELTQCANRRHFVDMLAQHRAMSERGGYQFTIAVVQVDQFADIVEQRGLSSGNEVLQLFSRVVRAALREVDMVARLDTDKFGLLLSGASEEDALTVIGRIGDLISQIQITDADDMRITASSGLTSYHGTESPEQLIEHAEKALDFAIEQGRDRVAGYLYHEPESESDAAGSRKDV